MNGTLYVIGTPIGNLADFSPRAAETLRLVDFIAAEDTRVTKKLLNYFGIDKPMVSYHEHDLRERGIDIMHRLKIGQNGALVSDAGMPCISDPGEDLIKLACEYGIHTVVIPGPSAAVAALCLSGLSTSRFCFEGFLSTNKLNRVTHLDRLRGDFHTLVFYEAPQKLLSTLRDMRSAFGNRRLSIARELTKPHEEIIRTDFDQAIAFYTERTPKGEFVLVIEGAKPPEEPAVTLEDAVEQTKLLIGSGMRASDAAKQIASETGFKSCELYQIIPQ